MDWRRLFGLSRAGQPYEGVVLRCNEVDKVPWPGVYGVNKKGELDRKQPLREAADGGWERAR